MKVCIHLENVSSYLHEFSEVAAHLPAVEAAASPYVFIPDRKSRRT